MPRTKRTATKGTSKKKRSKVADLSGDALGPHTLGDALGDTLVDPVTVAPTSRKAKRELELEHLGVGTGDTSEFPTGKANKRTKLVQAVRGLEGTAPLSTLSHMPPSSLIAKVDPSLAGDHSPSVASVNTTPDKSVGISGRSSKKGQYGRTVDEHAVPTLQFNTDPFYGTGGERRTDLGSAAHTIFTSLREGFGVGEKHDVTNLDDLLDKTALAYSPYNGVGEPTREPKRAPRVNVHAEREGGAKLHKSGKGVDPLIAQRMINLWYRSPGFLGTGT